MKKSALPVKLVLGILPLLLSLGAVRASAEVPRWDVLRSTDAVRKRNSQSTVDPWTTSSPAALFSRPTLGETLKFSSEAAEGGTTLALGFSPGAYWAPDSPWLMNFEALGSYETGASTVALGLKWSAPLRDGRLLDRAQRDELERLGEEAFNACRVSMVGEEGELTADVMTSCGQEERKRQFERIDEMMALRPGLSLGASVGYGVATRRLERIAANVAYDQKFAFLYLVANADLESDIKNIQDGSESMEVRAWRLGGGAGLAWRVGIPLRRDFESSLELSFGGKLLACLRGCGEESSTLKVGPQASITVSKDTAVGASLLWSGKGASLGEAVLGLSLSHTIGVLE